MSNTTLPGLKLKSLERPWGLLSNSWKSTALTVEGSEDRGSQSEEFFWGYLWHEAVEWEPVRRQSSSSFTLRSCLESLGWQAMDYASSICLKYLKVHSWTWATGERECKSRSRASNGSLVFAVARTQPICLSLQMNALWIYRHWLGWCKVSRIKVKNVWQLLPPARC